MSLMVGISGIRGIIGSTMTPQLAASAGCAMATFAKGGRIVIGRDSRPSGTMVQSGVVSGLIAGGCEVIDLGITSTPTVGVMVRKLEAAGGVVLTASHNPIQWNGIKFLAPDGGAPRADVAQQIIDIFNSQKFNLANVESIGSLSTDNTANQYHVDLVLKTVDVDKIRACKFRVVLDSINGAGGPEGLLLLKALGCDVIHVNAEPTGIFAHLPEPIADNLTDLCTQTKQAGAQVGFAQDPDADRMAIVDETGRYFGEEYTLALAAKHVFSTNPGPASANLSTSRMIDDLAAQAGDKCVVHRSAVGEANVAATMKENKCVIGGEGNGGVIDPRVGWIRDSLSAMALTLQIMTDEGKPLSAIVDSLPRYAMVKQKFDCDKPRIAKVLEAVGTKFASEKISKIDGVRVDWPEGWVHVRGSNTEPIMRIISEAADPKAAEDLIARVRTIVDTV